MIDGERVIERWAEGRLLGRIFERLDGAPSGRITITYDGGLDPSPGAPPPARVELDQGWFGYRIVLEGLRRMPL